MKGHCTECDSLEVEIVDVTIDQWGGVTCICKDCEWSDRYNSELIAEKEIDKQVTE